MTASEQFLLPNETTLIVACSAQSARCWQSTLRHGDWKLVKEFHDEGATLHERDIVSDKPGRSFDSRGSGRHAMAPPTQARDQEKLRFAKRIADYLNAAVNSGDTTHLVILADPRCLGLLRSALSNQARHAVVHEASKNLARLDVGDIRKYFQ